jgi:hypothetical protein
MTTCQIAFALKNRVVHLEEFTSNTPNVLQKMKTAVSVHMPTNNVDRQDIVLETMCAGSHVTIKSDQDAAKFIFGCAVDGKAKIKVKISRKPRDVQEKRSKLAARNISAGTLMEMPACVFVDQEFIRKLVELLDSWSNVEISYEDTCALIEALKGSILARESLVLLIQIPGRFLDDGNQKRNWTIPALLCGHFDDWIFQASQEQLLYIVEQLPTILDKLISRRGKLFEDVFLKQKAMKQILKIRLLKSKSDEQKETSFRKHLHSIKKNGFNSEDLEEHDELKQDIPSRPLQKQDHVPAQIKSVSFEKGEAGTESESDQEHLKEKEVKRQARLTKRMEKSGCKTVEELKELKAVKKEAQLARALEKYGCETEQELKQARLEQRLAKNLERYGCQNEEELKAAKLAKKLEKYGCQTIEEFNDLKKQTKLSKSNPPEYGW